jgi:hypothetical protein
MTELPIDEHVGAAREAVRRHAWSAVRIQGAWRELQARRDEDIARSERMRTFGAPALAIAAAFALLLGAWATLQSDDASTASAPALLAGFERRVVGDGIEADVEGSVGLEMRERTDARVVVAVGTGRSQLPARVRPYGRG